MKNPAFEIAKAALFFSTHVALLSLQFCGVPWRTLTAASEERYPATMGEVSVFEQDSLQTPQGEQLLGMANANTRQIVLRAGMPAELRASVLRHERCHIALADYGVELPDAIEESVCDAIGAGMRE